MPGDEVARQQDARRGDMVAVVMAVGGMDGLVEPQVRAVLAQDAPFPFELVLSLNTADTSAAAAIDRMVAELDDPRIRVVPSHDRRSASHARNVGARATGAPVLAFCDADDEVAPGWLAAIAAQVDDETAVGGFLEEQRFAIAGQGHWRPPATPGELPAFLGVPYLVSANMAVTRDAFEAVGGFDVSLLRCEDIAFSWALIRAGVGLKFAPDAVVHYRHRKGVRALVRQHYLYGRGMTQVLQRYGVPDVNGEVPVAGLRMLRPNGQRVERRTAIGVIRRGSIAAGRAVGVADRTRRKSATPATR
jgi:cellulose synthase/poly-beta-1,6-N-acetylglucosamine synthase-like glycosyltransferase